MITIEGYTLLLKSNIHPINGDFNPVSVEVAEYLQKVNSSGNVIR